MADGSDLLVITCAGGYQCNFLLPLIYDKYKLRLVVATESSQKRLKQRYPHADVVQADLAEPAQCKRILKGATRVYHIGPSLHPHELEIGLSMIDAAVEENARSDGGKGRFKHFVFSSVLNTQIRKMANHDRKRYVEEYLFESGLPYTVLNPCDFLNMAFPVKRIAAMDRPEYRSYKGLESKSAFLVLEDYAEASAKILDEGEKHHFAQYQMCSMAPVAYGQVARDLGRAIIGHRALNYNDNNDDEAKGKEFPVTLRPMEESVNRLRLFAGGDAMKDNPAVIDAAERLSLYYLRRGLQGSPNTLEWLLGRKPTGHVEWIERQLREFKKEAEGVKEAEETPWV